MVHSSYEKDQHKNEQNKSSNDLHVIYFHGIGKTFKKADKRVQAVFPHSLFTDYESKRNIVWHTHKYPLPFQCFTIFSIVSTVFFAGFVLAPIVILCTASFSPFITISLAVLSVLVCIILSFLFVTLPFMLSTKLFDSSIDKIDNLIGQGVDPKNIILLGHSFGGVSAVKTLEHFTNKKIDLGSIVLHDTFSSFKDAIGSFPLPQLKVASLLLPIGKILKLLKLEFNIADDIISLKDKNHTQIRILNHKNDFIIKEQAQLLTKILEQKKEYKKEYKKISYEEKDTQFMQASKLEQDRPIFPRLLDIMHGKKTSHNDVNMKVVTHRIGEIIENEMVENKIVCELYKPEKGRPYECCQHDQIGQHVKTVLEEVVLLSEQNVNSVK